jgi:hypothetical protein
MAKVKKPGISFNGMITLFDKKNKQRKYADADSFRADISLGQVGQVPVLLKYFGYKTGIEHRKTNVGCRKT